MGNTALDRNKENTKAGSAESIDRTKPHADAGGNPKLNFVDITGGVTPPEAKRNSSAAPPAQQQNEPSRPELKSVAVVPSALVFDNAFGPPAVESGLDSKGKENGVESRASADLPPGSVERIHSQILDALAERQKQFDVAKVQKQISDLFARDLRRELDMACLRAGNRYDSSEVRNPEYMKQLLSGSPDAQKKYEAYWQNHQKIKALEDSVQQELTMRRKAIADIANREARSLYPGAVMPHVTLAAVSSQSNNNGSMGMGNGVMRIRDSSIAGAGDSQLTRVIVHELKHAEQDGLIIRKLIDNAIPAQAADQSLTAERRTEISQSFKMQIGVALKPEILDQIFAQRNGRRLTADENYRADALTTSMKQFLVAPNLDEARNRITEVKDQLEFLKESPGLATIALDQNPALVGEDMLPGLFGGNVPPRIEAAIERAAKLGGSAKMPRAEVDDFAKLFTEELEKQLKVDQAASVSQFRDYTQWTHEVEARKVAEETDERLNPNRAGDVKSFEGESARYSVLQPLKQDEHLTDDEKRRLDEPAVQHEIMSRLSRATKGILPLAIIAAVALEVLHREIREEPYRLPSN